MVMGISGGLIFTGLILGAITNCIWVLIGFCTAGLVLARAWAAAVKADEQAAESGRLRDYPPYGY